VASTFRLMPRAKKGEGAREPERPRMAILSELLQFPHHDCSVGSTVEKPFLVDLVKALKVEYPPNSFTKDAHLGAAYTAATGKVSPPLGEPGSIFSKGTTVTDEALQAIIDGVRANGLAVVSPVDGAPAVRIALAEAEIDPDADPFDPLNLSDERKSALRSVKVRSGQGAFREKVLRAYGNRCVITGCDVQEALEAAHITPYKGNKSNHASNGLPLRADLHRLWDTGRLAIHEASLEVLLDAGMIGTDYSFLAGTDIRDRLPEEAAQHPSSAALEHQRKWAGL
jgi:hypothetical protein